MPPHPESKSAITSCLEKISPTFKKELQTYFTDSNLRLLLLLDSILTHKFTHKEIQLATVGKNPRIFKIIFNITLRPAEEFLPMHGEHEDFRQKIALLTPSNTQYASFKAQKSKSNGIEKVVHTVEIQNPTHLLENLENYIEFSKNKDKGDWLTWSQMLKDYKILRASSIFKSLENLNLIKDLIPIVQQYEGSVLSIGG